MEQAADLAPVRHQRLSKKHFSGCFCFCAFLLVGSLVVGAMNPLPIYKERSPADNMGTDLDLHAATCTTDLYGRDQNVPSCWHHFFKFAHVWTQYFALDAYFSLADEDTDVAITEQVKLVVTWYGRTNAAGHCTASKSDADTCGKCIHEWEHEYSAWSRPEIHNNVANMCMKEGKLQCGGCNLPCYLCLRNVVAEDAVVGTDHDHEARATCRGIARKGSDTEDNVYEFADVVCDDAFQEGAQPWEVIAKANQSMTRTITCPPGQKECLPSILFRTSHIEYNEFYFQVELDKTDHDHKWVKSVTFKMRYRNHMFSLYEIGFRYAFLIINVVVWLVFECKTCMVRKSASAMGLSRRRRSRGERISERAKNITMPNAALWLRFLQIGLVMFNNPLYIFEYIVDARRFFGIVGVILQVLFMAILMAYWLAEFEQLASDRADAPRVCECTCASVFRNMMITTFLLSSIPAYSFIKMQELANPLYDFTEEGPAWTWSKVFAGVWFGLYFCGLIYYTIKNFGANFCADQGQCFRCINCGLREEPQRWRKSWIFSLHGFAILVGISGLAFGAVYGLQTDTVFEFLFFYALFNIYIHALTFLYYPSNLDGDGISMSDMERMVDEDDEDGDDMGGKLGDKEVEARGAESI